MRWSCGLPILPSLPILLLACAGEPPPTPTTSTSAPAPAAGAPRAPERPAASGPRNLAMGTGEPREPQTFTLDQRLRDAVERGDRATIEKALERGADLQAKDDLGRTAALLATHFAGDLELVKLLHAKGAPIDVPDVNGRTALSFAAEDGRLDLVRWLAEQGAEIDRRDQGGRTALFHAALNGRDDVITFLADRGAAVDARDQFGDTPLMMACAKSLDATAALLVARGADPKLKDQEGRTASERSGPGAEQCRKLGAS
jgi:uncharacterized protein